MVSEKKQVYSSRLNKLIDTYARIMFFTCDNVSSQQMHDVRRALRGKGELIMGKKTMQRRIINIRAEKGSAADKHMATTLCAGKTLRNNTGLLFTNEDVTYVKAIISKFRISAPARIGAISPVEVVVPAGNTGMEPTMTAFFQALNIQTKIAKGTVEITADKKVLSVGDKVDNSTATLLHKLNINPFFYGLEIDSMFDNGVVFSKEDLEVTDEILGEKFASGIANITALSLGAGIPTEASFPILLLDAFTNLLAISLETGYSFPEFGAADLRKNILEGKVAAAPAKAAAAPAKEEKKPVKEEKPAEDEDDVGLGGFF